jgi:chaperonin cofactor prefoldin
MTVQHQVDLLSAVVTELVEARREDKARHEQVMGAFVVLEGRIDGLDSRMDGLEGEMRAGFERLDTRIDGLDGRMDGLEREMRAGFERLDTRIDVLSDDVRKNTASIEEMRGWIAADEAKQAA